MFLFFKLRGLVCLNINNTFIISRFAPDRLPLSRPLLGSAADACSLCVVDILFCGLHNLIRDGFLHEVYLALSDDLHPLIVQRNP